MKILITGANGFIGSYLMRYFKNVGYDVVGLVRTPIFENGNGYIVRDIVRPLNINEKFDVVIHAASELDKTEKKVETYVEGNIIGTKNILDFSMKNAKAFINLSAVRSFGSVECRQLSEQTIIQNPGDYGITKYIAEKLVLEANMPTISLILPGVVGKYGHTPWLMRVARMMLEGARVECYEPEALFNNIIHVDTLAQCIHEIIEQNIYPRERFLLGSKGPMRKYDVLLVLKQLLMSNSEIVVVNNAANSFMLNLQKAEESGLRMYEVSEELRKLAKDMLKME